MDDRWGFFMTSDTMNIYRSWTGDCIYKLRLGADGHHELTVNTDEDMHRYDWDEERQRETVNALLNKWVRKVLLPKRIADMGVTGNMIFDGKDDSDWELSYDEGLFLCATSMQDR